MRTGGGSSGEPGRPGRGKPEGIGVGEPEGDRGRGWDEVQVGGVLSCPVGETGASYFGKRVVNGLTTFTEAAKFRAMEFTQLVRVLIIEGRH